MKNARSIIIGISGLTLNKNEILLLKHYIPLGVILFSRNINNKDQLSKLINNIRGIVGFNCFILLDQEGGRVQRLKRPYWPQYPAADIYGKLATKSINKAERAVYLNYYLIGNDLKNVGINVNCAPCLDVKNKITHPVIGDRAFSKDAKIVSLLGKAASNGLIDSGVLPIIKHIPGHGRSKSDSHLSLPVINDSINILEKSDFIPFKLLKEMPIAMTAHILYKNLDSKWPITQSIIANNYIRNKINFQGILITDDIEMSALSGSIQSKVKSIYSAGYDIILICSGKFKNSEIALKNSKLVDKDLYNKLQIGLDKINKGNNFIDLLSYKNELSTILKNYLNYNVHL